MNLTCARPKVWCALLLATAGLGRTADATGAAVQMSPYEVSAYSVDFAKWIKIGSPHFVLYTDADFAEASEVISNFERLRAAAQLYFLRPMRTAPPTLLVLPTSGSDWRKIASKGNVQWTVAVSSPAGHLTDLVLGQYDWQRDAASVAMKGYAYGAMRAMNLEGPFWFARGASALFEAAEFAERGVVLGRHSSRVQHLLTGGWLPWGKFFRVSASSPEFVKEFEIGRYEGQCAVFVHYCMTHPDRAWLDRMIRWVALLNAGREATEEEFKGVFGQDWKAWQKTMDGYLRGGTYQVTTLPVAGAQAATLPARLPLPVREMRELFVLCQVLNQRVPASVESLDSVLKKGLKSEPLRELLAEACMKHARTEAGHEQIRLLLAAESLNPMVHLSAAMIDLARAIKEPGLGTRLGAEAAGIRSHLHRALELDPRNPEANSALVFVEAFGPLVQPANLAAIEQIYRRQSGDSSTADAVTALAVARWRIGDAAGARRLIATLQASPFADQGTLQIVRELENALEAGTNP